MATRLLMVVDGGMIDVKCQMLWKLVITQSFTRQSHLTVHMAASNGFGHFGMACSQK